MEALVETRGLGRRYGRRRALDGVDLAVAPGEIVGLVGPNGSGKTTLLRLLAGFLRPHEGEALVFGLRPYRDQPRVMERARFAFAPPALFGTLTPREHLRHLTAIRTPRMARATAAEVDGALAAVGLIERAGDRVRTFSFGMRQRLALAQALLPRPDLLVLDEPTDGLDPLGILELRALLARLRAEHGMAILLSSHLLGEVEQLVDHLLVLSEGRALFRGRPAELTEPLRTLRLAVDRPEVARAALAEHGLDATPVNGARGEGELEDELGPGWRELDLPPDSLTLARAGELLAARGVALGAFRVHRPTLEEALLARLERR